MALTNPRLQPADLFTSTPQPVHRAAQRHTPQSHRLSGMTANTITAATIDASCVGRLITPDDGGAKGCAAMVLSVSGTTATLDRNLPATDATSVSMWITGDMPVVATAADTAGSRDVVAAAYATAATGGLIPDDYYNNEYQLACLTGLNAGRANTITDFVASTGQFVVGFADDVASGDLFLLLRVDALESDIEMRVNPRIVERTFIGTGRIAAGVPVSISSEADATLEFGVKMLSASAGAGVQAGKPGNLNTYLEDCFDRHSDTGGSVVSANASIVNLNSSVLSQGGFLLFNTGQVIHVLATDTGGVVPGTQDVAAYGANTLTHASVQAGSDAYAFTWYTPKTQGPYRPRTLGGWRGGLHLQKLMGCMARWTLNVSRDNIARFQAAYMAPESVSYPLARPVALGATYPLQTFDSTIPTDPKHSLCLIDGVPINISDLSIDFGFEVVLRPSQSGLNESDGCVVIKRADTKMTFKMLADDDEQTSMVPMIDRMMRTQKNQFLWYKGRTTKQCFAIAAPAMFLTKAEFAYENRHGVYNCEATCVDPVDAGYSSSLYTNLPPISFGWGG